MPPKISPIKFWVLLKQKKAKFLKNYSLYRFWVLIKSKRDIRVRSNEMMPPEGDPVPK